MAIMVFEAGEDKVLGNLGQIVLDKERGIICTEVKVVTVRCKRLFEELMRFIDLI